MATLWAQREMVRELFQLEANEAKLQGEKQGKLFGTSISDYIWIPEEQLFDKMLKKKGKTDKDIHTAKELKMICAHCIKSGRIFQKENLSFLSEEISEENYYEKISERWLKVSYDKGLDILSRWYFWFKFMPEVFPQPTSVIVSVLASMLISTIAIIFTILKLT